MRPELPAAQDLSVGPVDHHQPLPAIGIGVHAAPMPIEGMAAGLVVSHQDEVFAVLGRQRIWEVQLITTKVGLDHRATSAMSSASICWASSSRWTRPVSPSTVIKAPSGISSVAPAICTAGKPYSRASSDPCASMPPVSSTMPEITRNTGVHPGSVWL